jgi:hypothetical protein
MTADRTFVALPVLEGPVADVTANGQAGHARPRHARPADPFMSAPRRVPAAGNDATGQWLIAGVCVLLTCLAVAMGVTSFHAQFTYIFATKRQWAPAVLEALGLDAGAVTFALLGIGLARLGRRAAVERVLVVACALGSCGMNVLNANLASPRSVAVYGMPPILFALTSDRLIAVIRRAALGLVPGDDEQRSAWYLVGRFALYGLRLAVDLRGTARGTRQAILNATPLPETPQANYRQRPKRPQTETQAAVRCGEQTGGPGSSSAASRAASSWEQASHGRPRSRKYRPRDDSKTARFLALVQDQHGPLASLPLPEVYRISLNLAPEAGIHAGSARKALRAAVLAALDGSS